MTHHSEYNRANYPQMIGTDGPWDICANSQGQCAAIPNDEGIAKGNKASFFGTVAYARRRLGLPDEPKSYVDWQQRRGMAANAIKPFSTYPENRERLLELARKCERSDDEHAIELGDLVRAILEDEAVAEGAA